MKVKWSRAALRDLQALHAYIAQDNPTAAKRIAARVSEVVETNLRDHPHMGRPGRVHGTRELVITGTSFIVPYRVKADMVQVTRVYHGARHWPDKF